MLRIGLLGFGYWGKRLKAAVDWSTTSTITRIYDIKPEEQKEESLRANNPEEIFASQEIDAVIIATPASTHVDLVARALQQGKHVLVEKPLALTTADALRLVEMAKQYGCHLMVEHTYCFVPEIQILVKHIKDDLIGKPIWACFERTAWGPMRDDINCLWDLGAHDLAILLLLNVGWLQPVQMQAERRLSPQIDSLRCFLQGQHDLRVDLHLSWADPIRRRQVTVLGTRGTLVATTEDDDSVLYFCSASAQESAQGYLQLRPGSVELSRTPTSDPAQQPLTNAIAAFASLVTQQKPVTCDGQFGARVVHMLEQLQNTLDKCEDPPIIPPGKGTGAPTN